MIPEGKEQPALEKRQKRSGSAAAGTVCAEQNRKNTKTGQQLFFIQIQVQKNQRRPKRQRCGTVDPPDIFFLSSFLLQIYELETVSHVFKHFGKGAAAKHSLDDKRIVDRCNNTEQQSENGTHQAADAHT